MPKTKAPKWWPTRKVLEGDDGEFYVVDEDGKTVLQAWPTRAQANEHVRALELEDEAHTLQQMKELSNARS